MGSNGIDVSNNNGALDLRTFKGLDFCIGKCSEGTGFVDNTFGHYRAEAESLGVVFGAYHFLHAENLDGLGEALWFLRHFTPVSGVGVWIDYETFGASPKVDAQVVALFAMTIKARFSRQKVGLYSDRAGMNRVVPFGISHAVDAYWLADPTGAVETPDGPMPGGASWNIHQYESLKGVDRNYSRWSKSEMAEFFKW